MQLGSVQAIHNVMRATCDAMGGTFSQEQTYPASGTCYVNSDQPSRVHSAPAPSPVITVSPQITTQVSPTISPIFQQQFQPSNSPAIASTQAAPKMAIPAAPAPQPVYVPQPAAAPVAIPPAAPAPQPVYVPQPAAAPVAIPAATLPDINTGPVDTGPMFANGQQSPSAQAGAPLQAKMPVDNTQKYMIMGLVGLGLIAILGRSKPRVS